MAAGEQLNNTPAIKKEELVREIKNKVNKANGQKGKIQIEYDISSKFIADIDTRITLQEQHIQELKPLIL